MGFQLHPDHGIIETITTQFHNNVGDNVGETTALLQEIEGEDVFPEADPESIPLPAPPPQQQPLSKPSSIAFTPRVIGVITGISLYHYIV